MKVWGSSPLARGLPNEVGVHDADCGIIPARAGFTESPQPPAPPEPDHPRSRGVYGRTTRQTAGNPGSSPLARGLRIDFPEGPDDAGIIPARAGFTPGVEGILTRITGSSPLARGLRTSTAPLWGSRGIIPARAGFTGHRGGRRAVRWDHPRSRGVYGPLGRTGRLTRGSSPLARGLRDALAPYKQEGGIIPARAGFTSGAPQARWPIRDHPRSRGVYSALSRSSKAG